jgi:hypothetical protein
MKKHIDAKLLREWIDQDEDRSVSALAKATKMSEHTIYKMVNGGYSSLPNPGSRHLICLATGLAEADLFPSLGKKEAV